MGVEIFDMKVDGLIDPEKPFETVDNLAGQVELFAQYPRQLDKFRIIRVDVDERSLFWPIYAYLRYKGVSFDYLALGDENIDWWHVINSRKILGVDIDNTLILWKDMNSFEVNIPLIECVNKKYDEGYLIVIWTARSYRFWNETVELLKSIDVKYDLLVMSKLYADKYIDDINVVHPERVRCSDL
jgi:hypothetical protein